METVAAWMCCNLGSLSTKQTLNILSCSVFSHLLGCSLQRSNGEELLFSLNQIPAFFTSLPCSERLLLGF